ncbi:thiolase family protein [Hydrogenophaga sp. BPS33]|uniref:thiolase family protein n=1 Tax=Hydrogenophaga sp. BPS33 TaxID=2651974 RepID=UPI0013200375|nr:thiolase family protein [Hydrogenophaga sp. BPS33]QHE83936.1 thiolase family protein [Hydrogenophaga sp. BPS33]
MPEAFIIDAVRSPMGRIKTGGAFTELHPVDLLAQVLQALVARTGIDPGAVDDVICGCVSQVGEQSASPGRMAWLAAGFPEHVPSTTVERKCGSSQQAVHFAAQGIAAGAYDIAIACGVESMSRVPMGSSKIGKDSIGPLVAERYAPGLVPQGVCADLIGTRWQLDREAMDRFAAQSHQRAAKAQAAGAFEREIVPITTANGVVRADETIRPSTTVESLAALNAAFRSDEMSARFPDVAWQTTAGNASQMTDGAAAMLLMSDSAAARFGLRPRARFVAFDVHGDSPLDMLTAPIPSTRRALKKAGMSIDAIDHCEINEAFASVPMAWLKELGADPAKLNPRGGAIALGHPLGASGVRLMTTMLHALEDTGGRYGLQSMCEAGGMANTTIIERL